MSASFFPVITLQYASSEFKIPNSVSMDGVWRSWLARAVWDREVEGSSPFTPTIGTLLELSKIQSLKMDQQVRYFRLTVVQ